MTASINKHINKDIFRAYDIRGEIGKEWCLNNNFDDAYFIGLAIGFQLVKRHADSAQIVVGRDGRLSSDALSEALINGLCAAGCDVLDIGLVATPVTYFALQHLETANAVMVTGSHNPPTHNGIKIVYEKAPLSGIVIETLYYDIVNGHLAESQSRGKHTPVNNIVADYQQAIVENIHLQRPLRLAIDASNGATALFAESLFTQLGCEVHPLYCELDGTFPNHSPDPTVPANLETLAQYVSDHQLDLGIAFDGDGDRMIAVDNKGTILWPDRILILLAQGVLQNNPGAAVVYDVKCSFLVAQMVRQYGGQPSMCISGHSILKMQMKRLNALLGGEFSGHIVMPDRWSYFDDGPYVAARLLEALSQTPLSSSELFAQLPNSYSTPQYDLKFDNIEQARKLLNHFILNASFPGAELSLIDGLRVDYEDSWGLIRSSNTSASLNFRFEATTRQRLNEIKSQFKQIFSLIDYDQKLPF